MLVLLMPSSGIELILMFAILMNGHHYIMQHDVVETMTIMSDRNALIVSLHVVWRMSIR